MTGKFPPAGVNKTVTELVLADTNKRHDWLKARGLETMMWGDMFLHRSEANDAAHALTREDSAERRAGVPRISLSRTGITPARIPTTRACHPSEEGFRIIGTPCTTGTTSPTGPWRFRQQGMGFLRSTWAG